MESVLHADIFFLVTTIAVVTCTVFAVIVGVYIVRILREVERMARIARREEEKIVHTMDAISDSIQDGVSAAQAYSKTIKTVRGVGDIVSFVTSLVSGKPKRRQTRQQSSHKKEA